MASKGCQGQSQPFHLAEATIQSVQDTYKSGRLTAHQLVQLYLNRIEAFDKKGPSLNAIITINPQALQEADRLDAAFSASRYSGRSQGSDGRQGHAHHAWLDPL